MKKYTVDFFISKLGAIPAELWTRGVFEDTRGNKCANGHCGGTIFNGGKTEESLALAGILGKLKITSAFFRLDNIVYDITATINDGGAKEYQQHKSKERIMAALHDAKAIIDKEQNITTVIKYIGVDVGVKENLPELVLS